MISLRAVTGSISSRLSRKAKKSCRIEAGGFRVQFLSGVYERGGKYYLDGEPVQFRLAYLTGRKTNHISGYTYTPTVELRWVNDGDSMAAEKPGKKQYEAKGLDWTFQANGGPVGELNATLGNLRHERRFGGIVALAILYRLLDGDSYIPLELPVILEYPKQD